MATVSGSPSINFLKEYNIRIKSVENLAEAMKMLDGQEVDAIVYDRLQLMYYINIQKDNDVELAKAAYYQQGYVFAFPEESNLIFKVNRTLLELAEDDQIAEITEEYLGKEH